MIRYWKCIWTIVDAKRYASRFVIYMDGNDEVGSVLEAMDSVTAILKLMIDGAVVSARISTEVIPAVTPFDLPSDAGVNSDVEDGGGIIYWDIDRLTSFKQRIPTLKESYYISGTNEVDFTANNELTTLVDWMTILDFPSSAFPSAGAVNSRGENIEFFASGKQVFKPRK